MIANQYPRALALTLSAVRPDLEQWLPNPALRVVHCRESSADPDRLWAAALSVRIREAGLLGRLIRWRIPGTRDQLTFEELFSLPPFLVLDGDKDHALVSGMVGRIWTIRRDYPELSDPDEFCRWRKRGTARVVFANWLEAAAEGRHRLMSETRVEAYGAQGRLGVAALRPLVSSFHARIGSDGIEAAVRRAERTQPEG